MLDTDIITEYRIQGGRLIKHFHVFLVSCGILYYFFQRIPPYDRYGHHYRIQHSGSTMDTSSSFISCFKQYPVNHFPEDTVISLVRLALWPAPWVHISFHTAFSISFYIEYPHMLDSGSITEYRIQASPWILQAVSFFISCGILYYFFQRIPHLLVRASLPNAGFKQHH